MSHSHDLRRLYFCTMVHVSTDLYARMRQVPQPHADGGEPPWCRLQDLAHGWAVIVEAQSASITNASACREVCVHLAVSSSVISRKDVKHNVWVAYLLQTSACTLCPAATSS